MMNVYSCWSLDTSCSGWEYLFCGIHREVGGKMFGRECMLFKEHVFKTPLLILQYNKPKLSSTFLMFELWKALYYLDYNLWCTPYFVQSLVRSILFNGACLKVICYHVDWNQKQLGHTFPMFWKSLGLFCCGPRGTVVDEKYMIGETTEKTSLFSPPSLPHKAGFRP